MADSSRFFANKACEFYPCHKSGDDINCLFCYCPLYSFDCPGDYRMVEKEYGLVKSCLDCTFPHKPENYDAVVTILKEQLKKQAL